MATGETSLSTLLASMSPHLDPETYIFATLPKPSPESTSTTTLPILPPDLQVHMLYLEPEGWTLITPSSSLHSHPDLFTPLEPDKTTSEPSPAEGRWRWTFPSRLITLTIHSSLTAVGLTAAFTTALGDAGISCNVVAAFYHDHILSLIHI